MTDLVLIQDGKAHQVIRDTTKAEYCYRVHEGEQEPRAIFPQATIDAMIETDAGAVNEGDLWDGQAFAAPAVLEADLHAYAAAKRYEVETAGLVIEGVAVVTDRGSQAMLTGAVVHAQINAEASIKWKTPAGFVTLNAQQIIGIGAAVAAHVEACFAQEADVAAAIAVNDITTFEEIDAAFAALGS